MNQSLSTAPGQADPYVLEARLQSVFDRLVVTSAATVVNSALVAFALERTGVSAAPLIWMGLVWALAAARIASQSVFKRDAAKAAHLRLWDRVSVIGALVSGLVWGIGGILLFSADATVQWLWIFLIAGMCAGAASLHSAHLRTALAFTIPCGAPMAVFLATRGEGHWLAAGGMIVAFLIALTFTAEHSSRQFGKMLTLQAALERRTLELDSVNRQLSQEIADHRSTSETLHQAQKMEAIGNLTGSLAHDFNNLLTVIVGNLSLIQSRSQDDRAVRLATSGLAAAARGARLTASLLTFARKQALRPELVDINDLVLEFAPLLRRAGGDRVTLEMSLAPGPCVARVDTAHFQSALLNLVLNAKDATPEGGRIIVHTEVVEQTAAGDRVGGEGAPERFVRVQVSDNGSGMAPDVAAKAFDPFFTTKASGKGSGLGLSQVYGFAHQSGGSAAIVSAPQEGTRVSISLPAWTGALPEPVPAQAKPALPKTPLRVLLVDDDTEVLATLREGLADMGWDVLTAPSGELALGMLDRNSAIDALVSDVSMPPGMGGTELARTVRLRDPKLPILLMSGFPAASEGPGREFGVLQKPLSPEQLAAEISAAAAAGRH